MVWGAVGLSTSFGLLTIFGGLAYADSIPDIATEIPGSVILYVTTLRSASAGWQPSG